MPLYYFNTADSLRNVDTEGTSLPDDRAARIEAIRLTGCLMNDDPNVLWDGQSFRVEVVSEANELLFTIITMAVNAPAAGNLTNDGSNPPAIMSAPASHDPRG